MSQFLPKRRLIVAAGASGALVLGARAMAQPARDSVVIGHSGPFSGPLASTNREGLDVAARVFDQVNAKGGVHGRRLLLETLDDAQSAQRAAENTRTLIEKRRAIALFTYRTTPTIQASLPIATDARVPFIAPQVGPSLLYQPVNPNVFSIRASYNDEVAAVLDLLFSVGFRKVAFLYANDAFGRDIQASVAEQMRRLGGQPVVELWIENTTTDAGQTVQALWAAQPLAVLIATNNRIAADVIKKFRGLSRNAAQFVTLSNNSSASFIKELDGMGRGVMVTQVLPFPYASMTVASRELRALLERTGSAPSYVAMHGYLAAKLVVEGLRRAGPDAGPTGLANALDNAMIDLGGHVVDYTRKQRAGSRFVELTTIGAGDSFYR